MIIPANSRIATQFAYAMVGAIGGANTVWDGHRWVPVVISSDTPGIPVDIELSSGQVLRVSQTTQVLCAPHHDYQWKSVTEITERDRLCMMLPDCRTMGNALNPTLDYMHGYLFGNGKATEIDGHSGIQIKVRTMVFPAAMAMLQHVYKGMHMQKIPGRITLKALFYDLKGRASDWEAMGAVVQDDIIKVVPPGCFLRPANCRLGFVQGTIESAAEPVENDWIMELATSERAASFLRMTTSVGLPAKLVSPTCVSIRKWEASYFLWTPTHYPTKAEMRFDGIAPVSRTYEFLANMEYMEPQYVRSSLLVGLRHLAKKWPNSHFGALTLRAGWDICQNKPPVPIYYPVSVSRILPTPGSAIMRRIDILTDSKQLGIDGFVVR